MGRILTYLLLIELHIIHGFLTTSKHPLVNIAKKELSKFKSYHHLVTVRTNLDTEPWWLNVFSKMLGLEGYNPELTGADVSSQNWMAEHRNNIFAQMMRCALYSSDLWPEYWLYTLWLAVYIHNRLPHISIKTTPYQSMTGKMEQTAMYPILGVPHLHHDQIYVIAKHLQEIKQETQLVSTRSNSKGIASPVITSLVVCYDIYTHV